MSTTFDQLTITNDFLFKKVMQNKRICKHLIEEILHIQIETLTFIELEKTIDIYHNSHGIRLDVTAHDEHHTRYNIEMQASDVINENTGLSVLPKRTRYYQAMLDMDLLKKVSPTTGSIQRILFLSVTLTCLARSCIRIPFKSNVKKTHP